MSRFWDGRVQVTKGWEFVRCGSIGPGFLTLRFTLAQHLKMRDAFGQASMHRIFKTRMNLIKQGASAVDCLLQILRLSIYIEPSLGKLVSQDHRLLHALIRPIIGSMGHDDIVHDSHSLSVIVIRRSPEEAFIETGSKRNGDRVQT